MTALRPAAGPALAVAAVASIVWLASGVSAGDVALFLGYQAAFVWGPGVALYALLGGRDHGLLRLLALGGMLGLFLECTTHVLAIVVGTPWVMAVLPLLGAVCASGVRRRGGLGLPPARVDRRFRWVVAGVAALAVAWVGLAYVPGNTLPGEGYVNWNFDLVYDLALAGEAKHHFPLEEPLTAGIPLSYHTFPYYDMAATSNVTGIDLATVLFRLHLVPLLVLIVLQLAWAGRALTRRVWVGPVAAATFLFVGELDLDPEEDLRYAGWLNSLLWGPNNHGFVIGLCFFIPAFVLIAERLATRRNGFEELSTLEGEQILKCGSAVVLAAALIGCAAAKGVAVLPVLGAGLGLWLLVRLVAERRLDLQLVALLAGLGVLLVATLVLQYPSPDRGSELRLLSLPQPGMVDARDMANGVGASGAAGEVVDAGLLLLGLIGCLPAIAIGIAFALRRGGIEAGSWRALSLCLLVAGVIPLLIVHYPQGSHLWPLFFGAAAASPLAAEGLIELWRLLRERLTGRAIAAAAAGLAVLLAAAVAVTDAAGFRLLPSHWAALSYFAVGVAAALAAAVVVARRGGLAARLAGLAPPVLAAILVAAALDLPIDASATADGDNGREPRGLTTPLAEGLEWVRENTDPDDVLAVSNNTLRPDDSNAGYAYYSAIAERRVLIGGYDLVADREEVPERSRLNSAIFDDASAGAVAEARERHDVRWLLVDKVHGEVSPRIAGLGDLRFSNPHLDVYEVPG